MPKGQSVRLFDVWLLGPAMVVAGFRLQRDEPSLLGACMVAAGVGTVVYNWSNYDSVRSSSSPVKR